jgi:hypothetical protein
VTQLGSLKAGVTLVPVTTSSSASFFSAVSESGVRGAIFSPNGRVDNNIKKSEVLSSNISELGTAYKGSRVRSSAYPKLDFLIQTGFYTIPGTFKFRDILTYANPNFLNFSLNEIDESQTLYSWNGAVTLGQISDEAANFGYSNPESTIVTLGNINNPKLFAKCNFHHITCSNILAGLTSFTNGNLSIFIPNEEDAISVLRNVTNPIIVHDATIQKVTLDGIKSLGINNFVSV